MRAASARARGHGDDPGAQERPGAADVRGELVRIDEAVLHDLSHELGNYFHKLYYYTESVAAGADAPDGTAAQKLGETVQRLQGFLNLALEYFQPARLDAVAMRAGDVARAIEALLRGEHPDASVEVRCAPAAADAAVMVDPSRLSSGLRIVARQLVGAGGPGTRLEAGIERRTSGARAVLEIALEAKGAMVDDCCRPSHRVVEWAVAGRMIELHGGRLVTNESRPGASGCVLTLPLSS